jgi:hypothetical protein
MDKRRLPSHPKPSSSVRQERIGRGNLDTIGFSETLEPSVVKVTKRLVGDCGPPAHDPQRAVRSLGDMLKVLKPIQVDMGTDEPTFIKVNNLTFSECP